jgi:hypothetical protein
VSVIDPRARRATVFRSSAEANSFGEDGVLEGGDVLPGFRCPLADVL